MWGAKCPNRIVMQFCTRIDIRDVVTPANFGSHRFRRFRMGGRISGFSIDFQRRPYNTLALPCQRVISVSQALIHTSPNVGEISSNTYEGSVFTRFYGSLPAMTLTFTFDFLTPKINQHICECKYICYQHWVNCLHWYGRYGVVRLPWPWRLIFDVISMSPPQVHTWPNFGEISSNIYEDIVLMLLFSVVTLICNPLT